MANNRFYDSWEFKQAHSYRATNPYDAVAKFEEYIKKYPQDFSSYIYYASSLITIGELDKAEEMLKKVEELIKENYRYFNKEQFKLKAIKHDILFNQLRLMSYREQYEELYKTLSKSKEELAHMNMGDLLFYCRKKLGKIDFNQREHNSYLFRQIVEYKESDFLEHIKKHMSDYNAGLEEPNPNIFMSGFPIKEVINEVKKYIPSDKKMCAGFWEDTYFFKYVGCGRADGKIVDYFKVVTFHGTNELITVCPVAGYENAPNVDLSYMIDYSDIKAKKKESQIDKFNKRFKR